MAAIETRKIEGASVYGVEQYSYVVDGVAGRDYSAALAAAGLKQAAAIEADLAAIASAVKMRQRKLIDLNSVLTTIVYAMGTMKVEDIGRADKSDCIDALRDAVETARAYGITIRLAGDNGNQIQRDEAQTAQANVKHALDMESNSLQQDTVTLQNVISKRDSSYQTVISIVKRSLNAGATGVLMKSSPNTELVAAIRTVVAGGMAISDEVERLMEEDPPAKALTPRQMQILEAMTRGLTNQEIADRLFISVRTVETHKNHIMQKLNLKSSVDLMKFAIRNNIISI